MKTQLRFLLLALLTLTSIAARASDWGCEVLLCLSNPGGPTEYSQCRPPIERLWDHLKHGGGMPSCSMAGSSESGGSWAKLDYIDTGEYCTGSTGGDMDMGFTGSLRKRGIEVYIDDALWTTVFLPGGAGGRQYCDSSRVPTKNLPPPVPDWIGGPASNN